VKIGKTAKEKAKTRLINSVIMHFVFFYLQHGRIYLVPDPPTNKNGEALLAPTSHTQLLAQLVSHRWSLRSQTGC